MQVVVLFNGGAIAVDKIKNSEVALVEAWYPGIRLIIIHSVWFAMD